MMHRDEHGRHGSMSWSSGGRYNSHYRVVVGWEWGRRLWNRGERESGSFGKGCTNSIKREFVFDT